MNEKAAWNPKEKSWCSPFIWKLGPPLSVHPPALPLKPLLVLLWTPQGEHSSILQPLLASFNQFLLSISLLVWFVSLSSQLAPLVSVTDIGGNFWGTEAEGGFQSPEAAPDPSPDGPPADTSPSEEEARLGRGTERLDKVRAQQTSVRKPVCYCDLSRYVVN